MGAHERSAHEGGEASVNYCCAMGNCRLCVERYKRIHAYNRAAARRLKRYGVPPPSPPQLQVRDEIVKVYEYPTAQD